MPTGPVNPNTALTAAQNTAAATNQATWIQQPFSLPQIQPSYPQFTTYPTIVNDIISQDYANDVEVETGEHDAVLRFYRKRGTQRRLVKELIVPLALLEKMNMPNKKRGK